MLKFLLKKIGLLKPLTKVLIKIGYIKEKEIRYKIGNMKGHNALIDTLIPQMVEIGDNFTSAPGVIITAHDASTYKHLRKYRIEKVIIGDNVFIGANSVVLPGIKIGNNAIIGAGSIVTKDVPNNVVVVGNPAKVLCSVEKYMRKCIDRDVLYDAPKTFEKKYQGIPLKKPDDIDEFQRLILEQVDLREVCKNGRDRK